MISLSVNFSIFAGLNMNRAKLYFFGSITVLLFMLLSKNLCYTFTLITSNNYVLPLETIKINVQIEDQIAVTRVEQVFYNETSETIEAFYKAKISENSTVEEFIYVDSLGNSYTGKILETTKAENFYAKAQDDEYQAVLISQTFDNDFTLKLGKIQPFTKCRIILTLIELLPYNDGTISYYFPISYNNQISSSIIKNNQIIQNFKFEANIKDKKSIRSVEISNSKAILKKISNNSLSIIYEDNNIFDFCNKFFIRYFVESSQMSFNFLATKPYKDEDGYFLLLFSPPEIIDVNTIVAKDIVFVIDISGSMKGAKIAQTKQAFNFILDQLNPNDRFNIILFSSDILILTNKPKLLANTEKNKELAKNFVNNVEPMGGTNIHGALQEALKCFSQNDNRTKTIVFLTDGEPTSGIIDIDKIAYEFKSKNIFNVRLFTLGIGNEINISLLEKLSLENYGKTYVIHENKEILEQLNSFYRTISMPLLVDVKLDFGNIIVKEVYPCHIPNLYKGNQLFVVGRYEKGINSKIKVYGNAFNKDLKFEIPANLPDWSDKNVIISKIWAKIKINHLLSLIKAYGDNQEYLKELIKLSKKYNIMTPYTSYVAKSEDVILSVNYEQKQQTYSKTHQNITNKIDINNNFINTSFQVKHNVSNNVNSNIISVQSQAMSLRDNISKYHFNNIIDDKNKKILIKNVEAKKMNLWGVYSFLPIAIIAPNFQKTRGGASSSKQICKMNLNRIIGAIDTFNKSNPNESINEINVQALSILCNYGYLLEFPECPENGVYYGKITNDLISSVKCSCHGSVNDINQGIITKYTDAPTVEVVKLESWKNKIYEILLNSIEYAINIILVLVGMSLNVYIFILTPIRNVSKTLKVITGEK